MRPPYPTTSRPVPQTMPVMNPQVRKRSPRPICRRSSIIDGQIDAIAAEGLDVVNISLCKTASHMCAESRRNLLVESQSIYLSECAKN